MKLGYRFPYRFPYPACVLAACAIGALSGCANHVLNNQLASSREAVDQARIVGAPQAAPAEFNAAVDKLNRAASAAKNRNDKESMRLAQEAQVDANLARARTTSAQARTAAVELAKSNQLLQAEFNRHGGER